MNTTPKPTPQAGETPLDALDELLDLIDFHTGESDGLPTVKADSDEVEAMRAAAAEITALRQQVQALQGEHELLLNEYASVLIQRDSLHSNNLLDACIEGGEDTCVFGPDCPDWTQGVTLLELLRFGAESYLKLHSHLTSLEVDLNGDEIDHFPDQPLTGRPVPLSDERKQRAGTLLNYSRVLCSRINLQVCVKHIDELLTSIDTGWLGAEGVRALRANVTREISCQFFVGIPTERQAMFQNGRKDWEEIIDAFPRAVDDVEEMNRSYALCRYTAAVFHSLMVVEHGLVELGPRIGATDPKEGWDASCRQLDRVVKAGRQANMTGLDFDQLDQLNACVQSMRLSWRNKISHATGKPVLLHGGFTPDISEEIIKSSRGFMRRLATVLKQTVAP